MVIRCKRCGSRMETDELLKQHKSNHKNKVIEESVKDLYPDGITECDYLKIQQERLNDFMNRGGLAKINKILSDN